MCRSGQGNRQAGRRRGAATIQSQRRTAQAGMGRADAAGHRACVKPGGGSLSLRGCLRKVTVITNVLPVVLASCLTRPAGAARVPTRFSRAGHTRRRHGSLLQVAGMSSHSIARRTSDCLGAARLGPHLPWEHGIATRHAGVKACAWTGARYNRNPAELAARLFRGETERLVARTPGKRRKISRLS